MCELDRILSLDMPTQDTSRPIWEGHGASYGPMRQGFRGLVVQAIADGLLTQPGHYAVVRLDRSVDRDNAPCIAWVGTVFSDMTVVDGLHSEPVTVTTANITSWPPRKRRTS